MAVPFSAAEEAQRPLQSIPYLLSSYNGSNAADVFASVASHFGARFAASPEQFMQVPVLTHSNAETIPANSLVRFRGMVVDMFNPEFFLGAFKENDAGSAWLPAALYTDSLPPGIEASVARSRSAIMERRPLLVTPVPHESGWAATAWAGRPIEPETPRASDRAKRSRQLPSDGPAAAAAVAAAADDERAGKGSSKAARLAAGCAAAGTPLADDLDAAPSRLQQHPDQQGGEAPAAAGAAAAAAADEHQQQQPRYQPGDCIVQVYGDADGFRLHDVVEVLGVLSVTPTFAALHMQQQEQQQHQGRAAAGGDDDDPMAAADGHDAADRAAAAGGGGDGGMDVDVDDDGWLQQERAAALPPTSQVMRLHALCIRKAAAYNSSSSSSAGAITRAPSPSLAAQMPLLRQRALSLLAAPLGGDELAAEYVLLASLGSILSREAGGAPGLVPLNLITHAPSASSSSSSAAQLVVPGLAAALRCLLPRVALLSLNLPSLNNARWYPQQAANTGRLFRGRLQLAEGTLLLLDETEMGAGELGDAGVKNLKALEQVLSQQQLPCGCQVYTQNLPVNQPAIVLSTGRSVLRESLSVQLPLQPQAPQAKQPGQSPADRWAGAQVAGPEAVAAAAAGIPELAALREYYAAARGLDCRLEQAAAVQCVARFRALQRADPGFGQAELEMAITLSKLLCSSLGQEEFSMDSWERVLQMEAQRKQRLAAALAAAPAVSRLDGGSFGN